MSEGQPFTITLRWDAELHASIAEATDLPGVTGKGRTRAEALAAVQEAIRWQAEAATEGIPPAPGQPETDAQKSP